MVMVGDDTLVTTQVGGGGTKITRKFTGAGMEVVSLFDNKMQISVPLNPFSKEFLFLIF